MDDAAAQLELELWRNARDGNWEAFEELLARIEPRVFTLALRLLRHRQDAEDITQQTLVKLIENLETFRGESSVSTWVLRIATNLAISAMRKRKPLQSLWGETGGDANEPPLSRPQFVAQWRNDPAELAGNAEVRQLLDAALDELDPKYRAVFTLRDVEQLSTRETAQLLGITENNVKVRLLRARLQLRERLTRVLGDADRALSPHEHD
jgi:RNA polymerase sigma-70 factor, ECF subfamily